MNRRSSVCHSRLSLRSARSISIILTLSMVLAVAVSPVLAVATTYTDPVAFQGAMTGLGPATIINFDEIDASPVNNITAGRTPFNGSFYASQGITFSNPDGQPLYIAPGGLFWNSSNSLSVSNFPFDGGTGTDDDLVVDLSPPATAVGFTFVDNGSQSPDEFVQFFDAHGDLVQQVGLPPGFAPFRSFLGIVSVDRPIARINIVEGANDGDDVAYDDFIFISSQTVGIDVKPGSFPNNVNPRGNGNVPVAILTTPEFDAANVNPLTVRFGPDSAAAVHSSLADVDLDGDLDLLLHFKTQETGIECGDTQASLTGSTFGGQFITGSDSVNSVGCRPVQITVSDMGPEVGITFNPEGFVINRANTSEILATTFRVGISKSSDGGSTWFRANNGLVDGLGINAIPMALRSDPNNAATAYAATTGDSLYRTTDFGNNWTQITSVPNPSLSDCAIDPASSSVIYALALFTDSLDPDAPGPLFKSVDGGASFVEVGAGLPDLDATTNVAITPSNTSIVYVLDLGTFEGVYKSIDAGATFTRLASSPSQPQLIYPHPTQPNTLLLTANTGNTGLFRSTNGGATFNEITNGLPAGQIINAVMYDPSNPSIVYAGGPGGLFRSTNGGVSFSNYGKLSASQLGFYGVIAIGIDPADSNVIYVNTSKGNFKSVNGGKSFVEKNKGWRTSQVNQLVFDNHSEPSLYATTVNTVNLLRTNNRGNYYDAPGESLPVNGVNSVSVAGDNRDHIVLATFNGIYRTTNGGATWAQSTIDTGEASFGAQAGRVVIDPSNSSNVYAVTAFGTFPGFYRSTDGGASFARSNTGLTDTSLGTVAVDPTNSNVIYVGSWINGAGAFKSTNGGVSFAPTGQTGGNFSEIVIDPLDSQTIYLGFRASPVVVSRSTDGGMTFSAAGTGLTGRGVRGLVIDPLNPSRLFVWLRTGGLFMSEDGADSWAAIDQGGESLRRAKPGRGSMAINPKNPNLIYLGSGSILEVEIKP